MQNKHCRTLFLLGVAVSVKESKMREIDQTYEQHFMQVHVVYF